MKWLKPRFKDSIFIFIFLGGRNPDPGLPAEGEVSSCCHHDWGGGEGGAQEDEAGAGYQE